MSASPELFAALWALAWTLVVAFGGMLWKTKATREFVRESADGLEEKIQAFVKQMMAETLRQDEEKDTLRMENVPTRAEMNAAIRQSAADIHDMDIRTDELLIKPIMALVTELQDWRREVLGELRELRTQQTRILERLPRNGPQ